MPTTVNELDIEATNYLMNEGYRSRTYIQKPKKKRKEEYKVCDFVDTMKMVQGSSDEEDYQEKVPRSKAAREEMDSAIPGETHREAFVRHNPKKFPDGIDTKKYRINHQLPKGRRNKRDLDEDMDTNPDKLLEEIDSYQKKKPKKSTKKMKKEEQEDDQLENELKGALGHEQKLDDLIDQSPKKKGKKSGKQITEELNYQLKKVKKLNRAKQIEKNLIS